MARVNLPTDVLRTFLTVAEFESFTRAGELLGRSQPAISLQMHRLEKLLGTKLIHTVGRRLEVTEDGQALAVFARQMLSLNDQAVERFIRKPAGDALRVGLPTDYAVGFLQRVLTDYSLRHPTVRFEIVCDLSRRLLAGLTSDRLDVVIAMTSDGLRQYLAREWVERPCWAAATNWRSDRLDPVPLVAHPEGCEYRNRMIQALSAAQREWRIVYCSPGITGLQNAVAAGLGVSALTHRTLTEGMRILVADDGFPPLSDIRVGLYYKHPRQKDPGLSLTEHLIVQMDSLGGPDFARFGAVPPGVKRCR
jgi:DNA-binding transcriptional LysR family regulator